MQHDFSLVFETDNEYWQRVLDIFAKSESYPKKVVSKRNLHHKFPRSFSKLLGEPVDNDKDNLISLSLADHFLVHYYYYLLAKKGFRQSMATAFTFMAKKCLKYVTPETAEAMAKDYAEAKAIAEQHVAEVNKGIKRTDAQKEHMSDVMKGRKPWNTGKHRLFSEEHKKHISESLKGKVHWSDESKQKLSNTIKGHVGYRFGPHTEETKRKMSESHKGKPGTMTGKHHSEETKQKMREAHARRLKIKKENKT